MTESDGGTYTCVITDQYKNTDNDTRTVTVIGECDLNPYILSERHTAQSGTHISQFTHC